MMTEKESVDYGVLANWWHWHHIALRQNHGIQVNFLLDICWRIAVIALLPIYHDDVVNLLQFLH